MSKTQTFIAASTCAAEFGLSEEGFVTFLKNRRIKTWYNKYNQQTEVAVEAISADLRSILEGLSKQRVLSRAERKAPGQGRII
jgi:hypothetical protein